MSTNTSEEFYPGFDNIGAIFKTIEVDNRDDKRIFFASILAGNNNGNLLIYDSDKKDYLYFNIHIKENESIKHAEMFKGNKLLIMTGVEHSGISNRIFLLDLNSSKVLFKESFPDDVRVVGDKIFFWSRTKICNVISLNGETIVKGRYKSIFNHSCIFLRRPSRVPSNKDKGETIIFNHSGEIIYKGYFNNYVNDELDHATLFYNSNENTAEDPRKMVLVIDGHAAEIEHNLNLKNIFHEGIKLSDNKRYMIIKYKDWNENCKSLAIFDLKNNNSCIYNELDNDDHYLSDDIIIKDMKNPSKYAIYNLSNGTKESFNSFDEAKQSIKERSKKMELDPKLIEGKDVLKIINNKFAICTDKEPSNGIKKCYLLNNNGRKLFSLDSAIINGEYSVYNNKYYFQIEKVIDGNKRYGIIDEKGEIIIKPEYERIFTSVSSNTRYLHLAKDGIYYNFDCLGKNMFFNISYIMKDKKWIENIFYTSSFQHQNISYPYDLDASQISGRFYVIEKTKLGNIFLDLENHIFYYPKKHDDQGINYEEFLARGDLKDVFSIYSFDFSYIVNNLQNFSFYFKRDISFVDLSLAVAAIKNNKTREVVKSDKEEAHGR